MACQRAFCRFLTQGFLVVLLISLFGCGDESPNAVSTTEILGSYTVLESSGYLAPPCRGTDGYPLLQTIAFRRVLAQPTADADFKNLLSSEKTAAQLYGLAGLFFTDSTYLSAVIPPYLESSDTVQVLSGGELIPERVSEIAEKIQTGELPRDLRDNRCLELLAEGSHTLSSTCVCTRDAERIMMGMDGPLYPGVETDRSSFEGTATIDRNLFEDPVFTADSELGKTRSATPLTDPDFSKVIGLLTNNKEDVVWLRIEDVPGAGGGGSGMIEKTMFGLNSVDFAGKNIVRIDMIVNGLSFITPGIAGGTDVNVSATFRIWGPSRAH